MTIGRIAIGETKITTKKRSGAFPGLCAALKEILESKITAGKKRTGCPGMDLWQIFVLSQVRLLKSLSYDDLYYIVNYDHLIRQIMGVEKGFGYERYEFEYQTIDGNQILIYTFLISR